MTPYKNTALAVAQEVLHKQFYEQSLENYSDKNYMDVIFITPP